MLQWHHAAVEPAGDARSDLWFTYHLGRRIREKLAALRPTRWTGRVLDLTWDYPVEGRAGRARRRGRARRDQRLGRRRQAAVRVHRSSRTTASTACGCWIYCGVYADGVNQAARRKPGQRAELGRPRVGLGLARQPAHPLQPRLRRPGRQAVERAQGATSGGTPEQEKWTGHDVPDFIADTAAGLPAAGRTRPAPRRSPAPTRSSCRPTARRGCSPRRAWSTARCRRTTSRRSRRCATRCTASSATRCGRSMRRAPGQPVPAERRRAGRGRVPVRGDHLPADRAPHRRRDEPLAALPGRAAAGVLLRGVAGAGRRARPGAPRLGHDRHRAQRDRGPGAGDRADDAADGRAAGRCTRSACPTTGGRTG